jgi:GT2 family glycosyltransferase
MTEILPITVAVSACDRPEALERCIGAIVGGRTLPAEILVVDQSADDRVMTALRTLAAPAVRLRAFRQRRRGLSASRNAGWTRATHTVVAFTDDDCVPASDWVAALRPLCEATGPDAMTGRVLPLGEERPGWFMVSPRVGTRRVDYRGRAVPWDVGTGGNFAVRRTWLERVGGFDERLGAGTRGRAAEDADMIYRVLLAGALVRYEPAAIVYHALQNRAHRLASRRNYGFGIGAFCGLHARHGDGYAAILLAGWAGRQCVDLGRALARRDWFAARQRQLGLIGGIGGALYGLTVGRHAPDGSPPLDAFERPAGGGPAAFVRQDRGDVDV